MSACSASRRLYHTADPTVRMLLPFAFHVIRNFFATSMYTIFVTNLRRSGSSMQSPTAYAVWKYPAWLSVTPRPCRRPYTSKLTCSTTYTSYPAVNASVCTLCNISKTSTGSNE